MIQYAWGHSKRYNNFSSYFKKMFSERVQKISVDAGFTCPNRDGLKAFGGCTYCNNDTFKPFYCSPKKTVTRQLEEGINFFSKKYQSQKYLAYFQTFSNTYAPFDTLKKLYEEALNVQCVGGLVIATRPDCVDEQILDYLEELAQQHYIGLEYGIESTNDTVLKSINRGHSFEESIKALELTKNRKIHTGIHLILGLPGISRESDLQQAEIISQLPFETLKLHQLQIIKNTKMAKQFAEKPDMFNLFTADEYINFVVDFLELLNPRLIVERFISQVPGKMLIAPKWNGIKNFEIVAKIEKQLKIRNAWQGKKYNF